MKTLDFVTLLTTLRNTNETSARIVKTSSSVINYKRLQTLISIGENLPESIKGIERATDIKAIVEGEYILEHKRSYTDLVNDALSSKNLAPKFVAGSRAYGDWIIPNKVMGYCGDLIIRGYFKGTNEPKVRFEFAGKDIPVADLQALHCYKPISVGNVKQMQLGLDRNECINVMPFRVDSIIELELGGEVYNIL